MNLDIYATESHPEAEFKVLYVANSRKELDSDPIFWGFKQNKNMHVRGIICGESMLGKDCHLLVIKKECFNAALQRTLDWILNVAYVRILNGGSVIHI